MDISRNKSEPETQNPRLTPWQLALFATVLFVVILTIDLQLPLGVAAGVPYVAVVLLGWWFPKRNHIIILAAISTTLTLIGYFYSSEGNILWVVHVNRFLALFAIWVSAVLLIAAKTATGELAKSEQRYMRLADNTPAGIWQITPEGKTVYINNALARMFELDDPEEAVGRFYADFVTPDSAEQISNQLPVREKGYTSQYEIEIVGKKGGKRSALLTGSPLFTEKEGFVGRIATLIDITDKKISQKALAKREALLSAIFNYSYQFIGLLKPDGEVIRINKTALDFIGSTLDDVVGKPFSETCWWLHSKQAQKRISEAINKAASGELVQFEETNQGKDGKLVHLDISAKPIFADDGSVSMLILEGRDITERKEAEKLSTHFGRIVERSTNEIYVFDADTLKFVLINRGARENLGYTKDELMALRPYDIKPEHTAESFTELIGPLRDGDKGQVLFETVHERKDGTTYDVEVLLRLMAEETPPVFVAIIQDITDRKQAEAQLNEATEHLRRSQKMDAVGQMVGGIAHDFNNILGIIMGNLEILRDEVSEESGKRVGSAMKGAKRGADLTRKLLAFSSHDNVETKVISIADVIDGMSDLLGKSLTPSIEIKHNLADDLWPVKVDPNDFEDVIINLALNARDAMPNGGKLVIEAENKKLDEDFVAPELDFIFGDYVLFSMGDTGAGMTPEVVEKALDPFFTSKEEGKGSGLGLSMVYGFVKRSGGSIKIYSEPGEGTTVRIYLPRSMDGVEDLPESAGEAELPRGTETVLVVDDEAQLVDVSVHHLGQLGYQTLSANSGEEALKILADNENINVLFSDIVMHGGMDGYELTKKALKQHPTLKVLLTTGFTTKHEDVLVKRLSPSFHLIKKPYAKSELARNIRQVLDS